MSEQFDRIVTDVNHHYKAYDTNKSKDGKRPYRPTLEDPESSDDQNGNSSRDEKTRDSQDGHKPD